MNDRHSSVWVELYRGQKMKMRAGHRYEVGRTVPQDSGKPSELKYRLALASIVAMPTALAIIQAVVRGMG